MLKLTVSQWLRSKKVLPKPTGPGQTATFPLRELFGRMTDDNASPPDKTIPLYRVQSKLVILKEKNIWIWEPANYELIHDEHNRNW